MHFNGAHHVGNARQRLSPEDIKPRGEWVDILGSALQNQCQGPENRALAEALFKAVKRQGLLDLSDFDSPSAGHVQSALADVLPILVSIAKQHNRLKLSYDISEIRFNDKFRFDQQLADALHRCGFKGSIGVPPGAIYESDAQYFRGRGITVGTNGFKPGALADRPLAVAPQAEEPRAEPVPPPPADDGPVVPAIEAQFEAPPAAHQFQDVPPLLPRLENQDVGPIVRAFPPAGAAPEVSEASEAERAQRFQQAEQARQELQAQQAADRRLAQDIAQDLLRGKGLFEHLGQYTARRPASFFKLVLDEVSPLLIPAPTVAHAFDLGYFVGYAMQADNITYEEKIEILRKITRGPDGLLTPGVLETAPRMVAAVVDGIRHAPEAMRLGLLSVLGVGMNDLLKALKDTGSAGAHEELQRYLQGYFVRRDMPELAKSAYLVGSRLVFSGNEDEYKPLKRQVNKRAEIEMRGEYVFVENGKSIMMMCSTNRFLGPPASPVPFPSVSRSLGNCSVERFYYKFPVDHLKPFDQLGKPGGKWNPGAL
jgi:hypothetical protein